jgi:predicted RNase H-like nuclease (RuvC/YqgF family)
MVTNRDFENHRRAVDQSCREREQELARQIQELLRHLAEEKSALWAALAPFRDETIPAHARKLEEMGKSLSALARRIDETDGQRKGYRTELEKALSNVCSEHLQSIDEKCQEQGRALIGHLKMAEGASKDAANAAEASAKSAAASAQCVTTAKDAAEQTASQLQATFEAERRSQAIADELTLSAEAIQAKWQGVVAQINDTTVQILDSARKAQSTVDDANRLLHEVRQEWEQREKYLNNLDSVCKRLWWILRG